MQNKQKKLPYVFVEIDDIEDLEELYPHAQASGMPRYAPPFAAAPYAPGQVLMPNMQPAQAANPYVPPIGPLAALQMTPQLQVGPYAQADDVLDVYADDEPFDDEMDEDYVSDYDEADCEDDFDDEDDVDFASADDDELNLETVVIPVFKSSKGGKGAIYPQVTTNPYQQLPAMPIMPVVQSLPYAYSPFRVPFVNPMYSQPRLPFLGASNGAMGMMQAAAPMQASAVRQPRSGNRFPNGKSAHRNAKSAPKKKSQVKRISRESVPEVKAVQKTVRKDLPNMPQEAIEALSKNASSSKSPHDAPMPQSSLGNASSLTPGQGKAGSVQTSKDGQTITASTDSVKVSVSVLPPNQTVIPAQASTPASAQAQSYPQLINDAQAVSSASPNSAKAGKKPAEPKRQKESFQEKAMRENAEKTHTSLSETNDPTQVGQPLLDANAIATSDMFSTPVASMNEGLKASGRKHVLVIVLVALILALVIAAVVCVFAVWSGAATIEFGESNIPTIQLANNS